MWPEHRVSPAAVPAPMSFDPAGLKRLSALLDTALDLEGAARDAWLDSLQGESAVLVPALRDLLARQEGRETADLLERGSALLPQRDAVEGLGVGDSVGPYRLLRELGAGGMGEVWLAERSDAAPKRQVALKLPMLAGRRGPLVQRFARERDILAGLEHPHIARLYDAGLAEDGQPYLALEYVQGEPIDAWCRARGLPVRERLALLLQVAQAVAYAHGRLVLHRDLKPANILVTAQGQARLLDFGIAKLMEGETAEETALTRAAGRVLTPEFASPEQVRGDTLGVASDVYSLGVVAYHVLTGARPYRIPRGSAAALEEAILAGEPMAASEAATDPLLRRALRGDLDAILGQALGKEPAQRYPTVDALAQDWRRYLEGAAVAARPDSKVRLAGRLARRHRAPLAAGTLTVAAFGLGLGAGATALAFGTLGLGMAAALWQAQRAQVQARRAQVEARTARAVQDFMEGIFRSSSADQVDPIAARQRTARELLDVGAARIAGALADAPEAKARVLALLASLYADIGEHQREAGLHEQLVALNVAQRGAGSAAHALALARWADTLLSLGQMDRSRAELDRADAMLADRIGSEEVTEARIAIDISLADHYRFARDARGLPHAERAERMTRARGPTLQWLQALAYLGVMQGLAGRHDEAAATLDRAIAAAPKVPRGPSWVSLIHEEASFVAQQRGLAGAAEAHMREALALETRLSGAGSSHAVTMGRQLARLLGAQGRVPEALALLQEGAERVSAWDDAEERVAVLIPLKIVEGRMWRDHGRPERALACLDEAGALLGDPSHHPRAASLAQLARSQALGDLGRIDEADEALAAACAVRLQHDLQGTDLTHYEDIQAVELALARGPAQAALAAWQQRLAPPPDQPPLPWAALLRADIEIEAGRPDEAMPFAVVALQGLRRVPEPPWPPLLEMRGHRAVALAARAAGRAEQADAALEAALVIARRMQDPAHGPFVRSLQALLQAPITT